MKYSWSLAAGSYSYSTTQVDVPDALADSIIEWGKDSIPDSKLFNDDGTKGREDDIHCTVLYGIVSSDPAPVRAILATTGPIHATLGKVSVFKNDDYDVVKINVKSQDLNSLHATFSEELENENKFSTYRPHITIAYVTPGGGRAYSGSTEFEGTEVVFNTVKFSDKNNEETFIKLRANLAHALHWGI